MLQEDAMIETYFSAPKTLRRLRAGLSGPHIDGFAEALERQAYAPATAVRYLRAAAHLGEFLKRKRTTFADLHAVTLEAFCRHLRQCRCPDSNGGRTGHHAQFGVRLFHQHLVQRGICPHLPVARDAHTAVPALIAGFVSWFRTHRGVAQPTLRLYARGAIALLDTLGEEVSTWTPHAVRAFLLDRANQCGVETTQKLITSTRAFLRYLSFCGDVRPDLALAIPAVAHWRLASLPRCLSAEELGRLIAACEGHSPARVRDHAIVLLLARLGLRAGDLAQLRLADIDWEHGTVQVLGKGRYQVRLPLPQDVGDALARYLESRPCVDDTDRVFLRGIAPVKPFRSGDGVSSVVTRALQRAGIDAPRHGAHLLRHTAATEMLRHGVPLDQIGLVLRHRSLDMSAYYAKVDIAGLRQIAQPWPEVHS
jgi:site-specific recombinase XerD